MQPLNQGGFTRQQVIDVLQYRYGTRDIKFRYDLLDKNERRIGTLDTVNSGTVEMQALADIKRSGKFRICEDGNIDYLSDLLQPFFLLKMPNGIWIEWSQGIFSLSSPSRQDKARKVWRDVEAYDLAIRLNDSFETRYTVAAGAVYTDEVVKILTDMGITKINITKSDKTLPAALEWAPGITKMEAVNTLLDGINYIHIIVDEWGYNTSFPYVSPADRAIDFNYTADEDSIICPEVTENLDISKVPNKWTAMLRNTDQGELTATYVNDNPSSITSTVHRGIVVPAKPIIVDTVADGDTLYEICRRRAFEDSQIYGHLVFNGALMPMHSYADVPRVDYSILGISNKYGETAWTLPMNTTQKMRHEVRRVVNI